MKELTASSVGNEEAGTAAAPTAGFGTVWDFVFAGPAVLVWANTIKPRPKYTTTLLSIVSFQKIGAVPSVLRESRGFPARCLQFRALVADTDLGQLAEVVYGSAGISCRFGARGRSPERVETVGCSLENSFKLCQCFGRAGLV